VNADVAVAILAGGRASRFPKKLEREVGGRSMIVSAYERARATGWPVYVVGSAPFLPELLDGADVIPDREAGGGPLQALVSACEALNCEHVVALAADEPFVDTALLRELLAAWIEGDEAAVPKHEGGIEPLAAAYDRRAVLREAPTANADGGSMHALLARLRVRHVPSPRRSFANVNTPRDYQRALAELA
jgi:molybdopterin-guanine dinucleotide biosynthesis protein A